MGVSLDPPGPGPSSKHTDEHAPANLILDQPGGPVIVEHRGSGPPPRLGSGAPRGPVPLQPALAGR